jgi:hypothetical protein
MRIRKTQLVLAACGLLAIFLIGLFRLGTEPSYQGRSLSSWLEKYRAQAAIGRFDLNNWIPSLPPVARLESPQAKEAAEAVRHIGAKAIPWLVSWMRFRPSPWKTRLLNYARKLPPAVQNSRPVLWLGPEKGFSRIDLALNGFVILGATATPAIPELAKIAADPSAPGSKEAIRALVELGPPAVPTLTNLLTSLQSDDPEAGIRPGNVNDGIRFGLGNMGVDASAAVPMFIRDLNDPNMFVAGQSAAMLGKIGQQSGLVVPALVTALDDPRWHVRQCAAGALGNLGEAARPAVPKLKSLLGTVYLVNDAAYHALRKIAPEVLTNDPSQWEQRSTR